MLRALGMSRGHEGGLFSRLLIPSGRTAPVLMSQAGGTAASNLDLSLSLRQRARAVRRGAGRRYRVATLVGFLNVHSEPGSPFSTDNIVAQCFDGEIVESIEEIGDWVCHDNGGWSIREFDGHRFLVPLE